ncbi:bifunctional serine/threonine-protein kinase/formylglycine-generating enzyme family protein [Calothrix sp. UHCC 0171]|uniref:bifunctional serine/threonine-protein kinase/formylglycine-generating enzyme family protein n=1 Tax=Calothrix sp. UHCC 0171 TaxID=3110245 RepID=UPI002B21F22B|nr:bifunctional serine/threonine-protein kinase/formylglycine-generating enzyme family protein [Calothrix sp. UHCC 0171]MEA5574602.1 bifunctional serine/threonine-protein kinase/formylglycine-generating enzyme family protein [Calothrix sp. UHCC 0171]
MRICQNPHCSNPFNAEENKFCNSCGQSNFGDLLRNRFRVLRLLGEGGFSKTYATEDVDRLDAPCVIKQFFPQVQGTAARAKAAQLFKEEAFRLYELGENHPSIPRLLAYFEQGASLYLVQEFIEGETLFRELQTSIFDEAKIRQLLTDILPVIAFIHSRNVIHRDIKPENIIRRHGDNRLVLIDFGGAKQITQASIARQATVIYTIGYAPSEQMAGFACHASDLYSLGVTCVRLLTKCLPQQDRYGNIYDPLYDAINAQWLWREMLSQKNLSVSEQLGYVLDKLLKNLVRERYQSALEVLQDLNNNSFINFFGMMTIPQLETSSETSSPNNPPIQTPSIQPPPIHNIPTNQPTIKSQELLTVPAFHLFEFEVLTVDTQGREITRERNSARYYSEDLGGGIFLEMVSLPSGDFLMGSRDGEGDADERPQHLVTIEPLCMGKYPITQAQWRAVAALPKENIPLNPNPSKFKGANRPVENVSWHEAQEFCDRLEKKTGRKYRLPSEAEWEYACRAGTTTPFHFGEIITPDLANCGSSDSAILEGRSRFRRETTPVGSFELANNFGLYDMHGLVWEWCADPWHNNYVGAPTDGRVWEWDGDRNRRVLRGGSWSFSPVLCRSASRSWNESDGGLRICGFRVVVSL